MAADGAPRRDPAEVNLYCHTCHARNWPHMPRLITLADGWARCSACKTSWKWPPRRGFDNKGDD